MPTDARCRRPISTAAIEVVQCAILEPGLARSQEMTRPANCGEVDRATREPGPPQRAKRTVADEQASDAGRIAKHLVERQAHELRAHRLEIELVGGNERRGIEQHIPAARMRAARRVSEDA